MKKSFDDVLVSLGEFGRYQKRVYFLLFLPTAPSILLPQTAVTDPLRQYQNKLETEKLRYGSVKV